MSRIEAARGHDLTDVQWQVLQKVLPAPRGRGRPREWPLRNLIDGLRYRVRVGCPWRDIPDRYGPWWCLYRLFASWQLAGVWQQIEDGIRALANGVDKVNLAGLGGFNQRPWTHPRALVAGVTLPSGFLMSQPITGSADPGEGGPPRRIWPLIRTAVCWRSTSPRARPGDSPEFIAVLEAIRVDKPGGGSQRHPTRVLADKAYSSRKNRTWLRNHRIRATIPIPRDQVAHRQRRSSKGGRPLAFDADRYKDRHAVECGINKLKHHRSFATGYDKLAVCYAATIHIAVINGWLKRLS